ncbi:MAG: helix-turn-helix transcriptional regulator [Subdoligranulum sp.]|nr:helix-turn-helix transcriptional regulator [Subdoligranulum sp.]
MTQEQAAELSGLSQTYIANVERGARGLGDDSIIGLANALQTSTDYILLGKKVQPSDCEPIVQLLQQLDSEQLNDLLQIIRIYCKRCGCSIS